MDNVNVNTFFVSEKISKIRWIPEHLEEPNKFITGSWDNSNRNHVKLWKLTKNDYSNSENEHIPKCFKKLPFKDDITEIKLLNSEKCIFSSADGKIRIINLNGIHDSQSFKVSEESEVMHKNKFGNSVACVGLSTFDKNVATIGEDGKLNILSASQLKLICQMEFIDSCSLMAVCYINHNEILASNRMGVIRIFDTRLQDNKNLPATLIVSFENENKSNFATSLCYHPTQKHIVFAGSDEGSITIWDLRQPNFPASYLSAHSSTITEINFDKTHQTKLFTASENGELWQWNQNSQTDSTMVNTKINSSSIPETSCTTSDINPWLNGERTKTKINVTSIITGIGKAVNSFDAYGSKIICGCDNESVYYVNNMF